MAEEIRETEVVAVTRTVEVTREPEEVIEAAVVDWNDAPVGVEDTAIVQEPLVTYYAPRGKWDFTDPQRIVLGVLIWLNILVLVAGYLALTGYLGV